MGLPFKTKICGVTRIDDAQAAVEAGADAIGLNFYSGSKRYLKLDAAAKVAAVVPKHVAVVGVFVRPTMEDLHRTLAALLQHNARLDWIQIHGAPDPDALEQYGKLSLPVLPAVRWGPDGGSEIDSLLQRWNARNLTPHAMLIDAYRPGEHGGTGQTVDWPAVAGWRRQSDSEVPIVLAGGLRPENVAEAIRIVRPAAVDTASGVESAPGRKDRQAVRRFVAAAKRAFSAGIDCGAG